MRFWKNTERLLLIVGVLLIVVCLAAYIHRTVLFRAELRLSRTIRAATLAAWPPISVQLKPLNVARHNDWEPMNFSDDIRDRT